MGDINNITEATQRVSHLLHQKKLRLQNIRHVHQGRHAYGAVYARNKLSGVWGSIGTVYIVYKRAVYCDYGREFKGKGEAGETINKNIVAAVLSAGDCRLILFCYENGKVYGITPKDFNGAARQRTQHAGEVTLSVPVKLLKPFKELVL